MKFKIGDRVRVIDTNYLPLVVGSIHTITSVGSTHVSIDGDDAVWLPKRFELVEVRPLDYIGKTVKIKDSPPFIVEEVVSHTVYRNDIISKYAKEHGNNFFVLLGQCRAIPLPLAEIVEPKREVTIDLNKECSATITKDSIKVGCQTFPVSVIKDINDALEKLTPKTKRTLKDVKVGDKVRTLKPSVLRGVGDIHKVNRVVDNLMYIDVKGFDTHTSYYTSDTANFELVDP